ncbi:glycosyltransferase family 4 protein [Oceanihabitans sediminis]|uniref:glycosyltransferase family 4 protein n=1 Tax=Oceanihabitans sediminis TaxID=1812012 RepID=UPI00299EBC34|nr:glycosyltransferase family 4 protein [Oceanihabitans sediminis]MDX1774845.1 glycosyltransferase family 4 protein [Oceanihabitans sediminis]
MKSKRILIVSSEFPPQPGGIGNHAYNLALYFSKHDYVVTVIADQRDVDPTEEVLFDENLPFVVKRIPIRSVRFLMYFQRILITMQAFRQTDHVIATGKFSLWNVAFCSLLFKRNTMAVIHGTEVNFKSAALKKSIDLSLKCFDSIVAVSSYTKQLVAHLHGEVQVIPNGIDLNHWQAHNLVKCDLKGSPVITTVGRVSSRKGQLEVIKLLPELKKHYPNIDYHCFGIPTEADAFMEQAKELGVENEVHFHGAVDDKTLKEGLLATDVFVMLSSESETGDVEGFGIAILEANVMGVPAIGAKGCGIADAILDGKTGFLVNTHSVLEFQQALEHLLTNKDSYSQSAKSWAVSHSWDLIIKKYIEMLEA